MNQEQRKNIEHAIRSLKTWLQDAQAAQDRWDSIYCDVVNVTELAGREIDPYDIDNYGLPGAIRSLIEHYEEDLKEADEEDEEQE